MYNCMCSFCSLFYCIYFLLLSWDYASFWYSNTLSICNSVVKVFWMFLTAWSTLAGCSPNKWSCWLALKSIWCLETQILNSRLLAWLPSCCLCSKSHSTILCSNRNNISIWYCSCLISSPDYSVCLALTTIHVCLYVICMLFVVILLRLLE